MSALPPAARPALACAPAVAEDAPTIARLVAAAAPDTIPVSAAEVRRQLADHLVIRHRRLGVVATAAVRPLPDGRAELRSVAVDPAWRGAGLGAWLVRRAVVIAAAAGRELVCVSLSPAFFRRFGFEEVPLASVPGKPRRPDRIAGRQRVALVWRGPAATGGRHPGRAPGMSHQ